MKNTRRRISGVVTKLCSEKTVSVRVDRTTRHPLYGKVIRHNKAYMAHDLLGCSPGDKVRMVESKPISKRKRWVIEEILDRPSEVELSASQVEATDVEEIVAPVEGEA